MGQGHFWGSVCIFHVPVSKRKRSRMQFIPSMKKLVSCLIAVCVTTTTTTEKRALTNYAMFQIPLALLLTLESIGPLYSLPLSSVIQKEYPSFRASFGAILAVSGIALLSLEGQ